MEEKSVVNNETKPKRTRKKKVEETEIKKEIKPRKKRVKNIEVKPENEEIKTEILSEAEKESKKEEPSVVTVEENTVDESKTKINSKEKRNSNCLLLIGFLVLILVANLVIALFANTTKPAEKEFSIKSSDNYTMTYTAKANWLYDVNGYIYEVDGDVVTSIGQTIATSNVTVDDFNTYINQVKDTYNLVPLNEANSYKVVFEDDETTVNYILFDQDAQVVYEMFFMNQDEETLTNLENSFLFNGQVLEEDIKENLTNN